MARLRAKASGSAETVPVEPDLPEETAQSAREGEQEMISKLEARNSDVVAHEAAHVAAGGSYSKGGAGYTYQIGPDGKPYAIGGQVSIDMSPVPGNPRATIAKMTAIRAAAASPADPSGQDMSVAAAASQIEAQARAQLDQQVSEGSVPAMRAAADRYQKPAAATGMFVGASA